jgi:bacterioferritin-associated ferredoxin
MIICSCNVISDHDVRAAVNAAVPPRTCIEVYDCLGGSAQCGRCVRAIKKIMSDALGHTYADDCGCND